MNLPLGLAAFWLIRGRTPGDIGKPGVRVDLVGAVLAGCGLGLLAWALADALVSRSLALRERNMLAHRTRGLVKTLQRDWDAAIASLEHAASFDPADPLTQAMLARVGLGDRVGHYPRQLSGGEQQRVALARASVTRPAVLFADEPTGNLDTATGESICQLLFELNRESGTTLMLVTHDTDLAARCQRTLTMSGGRLV